MSELSITLNGEARQVPGPMTLAGLLAHLGLDPRTVVVERNRPLVRPPNLAVPQVAFATDSTNTGLATIYTWGPGVDHLVAMKVGTTHYTVVTDAMGSVRALVRRQDGVWAGRLRYDPYGQLIDSAGPQPALRYRWTGREWDAETGFYFHRSRYYDPGVGRFVQEDQIGYAGGGNLYAYVNGNVLQARDPGGMRADYSWAGLCIGDFCFGDVGDGLTGGGGAGRRIAELNRWGRAMTAAFDMVYSLVEFADGQSVLVPGHVSMCTTGRCPGGLTEEQYKRILVAIAEEMTAPGGMRVNGFLQAGRIHSANFTWLAGANPKAFGHVFPGDSPPRNMYLNSNAEEGDLILDYPLLQLASTLLHEAWHLVEYGDRTRKEGQDYYDGQGTDVLEERGRVHACQDLVRRADIAQCK